MNDVGRPIPEKNLFLLTCKYLCEMLQAVTGRSSWDSELVPMTLMIQALAPCKLGGAALLASDLFFEYCVLATGICNQLYLSLNGEGKGAGRWKGVAATFGALLRLRWQR